jgi:hypothetical protein
MTPTRNCRAFSSRGPENGFRLRRTFGPAMTDWAVGGFRFALPSIFHIALAQRQDR